MKLNKKILFCIRVIISVIISILCVTYFLGMFDNALVLATLLVTVNLVILCLEKWNTKRKDSIIAIIGLVLIIILELIYIWYLKN